MASSRWSLRLFGGFELSPQPSGKRLTSLGKRERVLLAYLALSPDCRQHRRKLATLLWGDSTDETALDNLRTCVWSLRKALEDTQHRLVASEGESIALHAAAFDVDVLLFRRLAAGSQPGELEAAAKLYSGEFLDGLSIESEEFESWRRAEATRHRALVVDVLTRLMNQLDERGEAERAIVAGTRILELEPLHEPAVRQLMRLYSESGRRGPALQLYRALADALRTDLHTQPDAATRHVFTDISRIGEEREAAPVQVATKVLPAGVAIAVLPFANMSGDASQEFFSDGMTEEITSALAKAPKLQVIARTSAFQFKGKHQDVRTVGETLGVSHLIDGSVRKVGDRLRITAQLIHARDGVHLWSESYDRQLTDIFAIQEDIARAIAAALRGPLGLEPGERLVPNRTADLESYQQYLVARGLYRARGVGLAQAIATLEPLVARDPGFAPAWALLARCYSLVPLHSPVLFSGSVEEARRSSQILLSKMEVAGQRAIELDPKHTDGYVSLACFHMINGKWAKAEDLFHQALMLDANDPEALHFYSLMLTWLGKGKLALAMRERLRTLEPLVPVYNIVSAVVMWINGDQASSISIVEAMSPEEFGGYYRNVCLAIAYAALGRFADAADMLQLIAGNLVSQRSIEEAARLLRTAPARSEAPESLPHLEGELGFVYEHVGALERLMEWPERNLAIGYVGSNANYVLWHRGRGRLRKTERFKSYVRASGMVDYWRERGWPDSCRPSEDDDFVCN
jgi:TolB-like protein